MSTTEDKFRAFLEGLEMQKIDELMGLQSESLCKVAETMTGTIKENMIRAFVQGAKYGWYEIENITDDYNKIATRALEEKKQNVLERWFDEKIRNYFIYVDPAYATCEDLKPWLIASERNMSKN